MKKLFYILTALIALTMVSCSESDGDGYEFQDWQNRNNTYFENIYKEAKGGKTGWMVFNTWSKTEEAAKKASDHIVVQVIKNGTGTVNPLYTDSVRVHYEGRLMPSASYPEGYVFQSTWTGKYNEETMVPTQFVASGLVDGFTTALLHMHTGDRWRVFIPYELGYGTAERTGIPAYSTLIFDLTLEGIRR